MTRNETVMFPLNFAFPRLEKLSLHIQTIPIRCSIYRYISSGSLPEERTREQIQFVSQFTSFARACSNVLNLELHIQPSIPSELRGLFKRTTKLVIKHLHNCMDDQMNEIALLGENKLKHLSLYIPDIIRLPFLFKYIPPSLESLKVKAVDSRGFKEVLVQPGILKKVTLCSVSTYNLNTDVLLSLGKKMPFLEEFVIDTPNTLLTGMILLSLASLTSTCIKKVVLRNVDRVRADRIGLVETSDPLPIRGCVGVYYVWEKNNLVFYLPSFEAE